LPTFGRVAILFRTDKLLRRKPKATLPYITYFF
jgi:hypothetical protein